MPSARLVRMTLSIDSILPKRIAAPMGELLNMISIANTRFPPLRTLGSRC